MIRGQWRGVQERPETEVDPNPDAGWVYHNASEEKLSGAGFAPEEVGLRRHPPSGRGLPPGRAGHSWP